MSERPPAEHIGWWDDYPVNWNILVAGGKEKNKTCLTNVRHKFLINLIDLISKF